MKRGLFLATFLLIIPSVSAQFYYGYLSGPIGVLGGFNFANIYSNYAVYIDAIIFLLIFLGLGKLVFGLKEGREREEPGYKLLYIGLALLMTVSLLLLESRMGFTLLDLFGPWVSFVLLLILTYASYAIISEFIKNKWIVFGLTLVSFLFFLDSFYIYFGVLNFLGEFVKSLFDSGNHRLLYLLALILLLIGIFRSWKGKETEGGAGAPAGSEEGPRLAPSAAGPEGPITVEREPPRARELPAEVIATLQEKDRVIAQSQEQINALAGAIEALNKKIQNAIEAGRADFAEKMAAQAREYQERIARIKVRRRDVLRKVAESFNQKLKALEAKIEEQKREYENLLNELRNAKTRGEEEAARSLAQQASKAQEEIKNRENEARAVKEEIQRIFAEGYAAAGEAEKFDWEREKEKFGYLETEIMRPKPPLLLPPQKEIKEEEKRPFAERFVLDDPNLLEIAKLLNIIARKRMPVINVRIFLLRSLFVGAKSEADIGVLQVELNKLGENILSYLKTSPDSKFAPYLSDFLGKYSREKLSFIKVLKYGTIRDKARNVLREIKKVSKPIYTFLIDRYEHIYNLEGLKEKLDEEGLKEDRRAFLEHRAGLLTMYAKAYERVVGEHFGELKKVKDAAGLLLKILTSQRKR